MISKNTTAIRVLDAKRLLKKENMQKYFLAVEKSYADFSKGNTTTPQTVSMQVNSGTFFSFASFIHGSGVFISKLGMLNGANAQKGIPTVNVYLSVFDSETGVLKSVIKANDFVGVRTALSTAVGVKHLLPNPHDLVIFGSGVQAESHAKVLSNLFPSIIRVLISSPNAGHLKSLVERLSKAIKPKVFPFTDGQMAMQGADLVVCATNSTAPVFEHSWLGGTPLVVSVGSMTLKMKEISNQTMGSSYVVVDAHAMVPTYAEIQDPIKEGTKVDVVAEIGQVVAGERKVPDNKIRVFKHHGLPVTDAALVESIFY